MTPPTNPRGWPEHARFDCVADDGTKHTIVSRKEPQQYTRTLDGVHPVGAGRMCYFMTNGTPVNPIGQEPTEFTIYNSDKILRKI